jgi:hypothetical protein
MACRFHVRDGECAERDGSVHMEKNMVSVTAGIAILAGTVAAFFWGIPKNGMPSRVPNKWGIGAAFPILVMCAAVLGIVLVTRGIYP